MNLPRFRLFVAGMGMRGDGYPNASNTLRILRENLRVDVHECGGWMPEGFHLWKIVRRPRAMDLLQLVRLFLCNLMSAMRLLVTSRRGDFVYVPYPSIFLMWLLSWIPERWRPRCLCDAYITLWDTLYQDRIVGRSGGAISRVLRRVETRALSAAYRLIVDTSENADHVAATYGISRTSVLAFPLAIDESAVGAVTAKPKSDSRRLRILFIGTFVPLQGTEVIARSIQRLRDRSDLEFVLIGDGQQAPHIAAMLEEHSALRWVRGWMPASALAWELSQADICLGVFGGDGKAARVLPFKLYLALAAGKAIITQKSFGLPASVPPPPVVTVAPDGDVLAEAIIALAEDASMRGRLARDARRYYQNHLGSNELARIWKGHLSSWLTSGQNPEQP